MGSAISRAQFLRGDIRGERRPVRPPWSLPEADFVAACDRCGACVQACEAGVLQSGRGGYPIVDFAGGECTFCAVCAAACKTGALHRVGPRSAPWAIKARIGDTCLAYSAVECRACAEQCDSGALRFRLIVGGVAQPQFEAAACSGCGACVRPCPVNAIAIREPWRPTREH